MEHAMMTATDVIEIVRLCQEHALEVILDGGWGVDALLGEQTRPHEDLDIAMQHRDVPKLRALLEARGFHDVPRDDTWECNFVLGDAQGRLLDVHSCTFDAAGNNIFGVAYPYASLQGHGAINGFPVKCITPEWLVAFHTGYPVDANDYHDVSRLCQRFGIAMPEIYARFVGSETTSHP